MTMRANASDSSSSSSETEPLRAIRQRAEQGEKFKKIAIAFNRAGQAQAEAVDLLQALFDHCAECAAQIAALRGHPVLFQRGAFSLHSGALSDWKIECDALTDRDLETLAGLIVGRVGAFSAVEGVPTGGDRLAVHVAPFATTGPLLIVDDVLTSGASMEQHRAGREAVGVVLFARGLCPSWVTPLFQFSRPAAPAAQEDK